MHAQLELLRQQIRKAMSPRSPLDRLVAFRSAFAALDRLEALCDEQTACIDALDAGLTEIWDDDIEHIAEFLPFPPLPTESEDMVVVGAQGEEWSLTDVLKREG